MFDLEQHDGMPLIHDFGCERSTWPTDDAYGLDLKRCARCRAMYFYLMTEPIKENG